jgi:SAM-dependent methyltransferase
MDALTTTLGYLHGYSEYETRRLADQADTLAALLHAGTAYPAGDRVLEVGCGVGAQTAHLVRSSPGARLVAVDLAEDSLAKARARVAAQAPGAVVHWLRADLHKLPFPDAWFDHLFVCFVLEHLPDPVRVLAGLGRVLRPGGTITVIERDHGSAVFHPDSLHARAVIGCQVQLQARDRRPTPHRAGRRHLPLHLPQSRRPQPRVAASSALPPRRHTSPRRRTHAPTCARRYRGVCRRRRPRLAGDAQVG